MKNVKPKAKLEILEIETGNYHLFVQLLVCGMPCRLLVDTGASKTVFDADRILSFVKQNQIKENPAKSIGLGTNAMETFTSMLSDMRIGQLYIKKWEVAVLPINHVNETYALAQIPAIDGVLGSDILMKYQATINYKKAQIKFNKY